MGVSQARHSGRTNSSGSAFAWSLLDYLLMSEYGMKTPETSLDAHGKPYFPSFPKIHFSLGHTATHVICALSDGPVGCDIETHRGVRPGLEARIMTAEERRDFNFFDLWVLRESFYKLTGQGDLRRLLFRRHGGEILAPLPEVCSQLYSNIEGCSAALCCYGSPPERLELLDSKCLMTR